VADRTILFRATGGALEGVNNTADNILISGIKRASAGTVTVDTGGGAGHLNVSQGDVQVGGVTIITTTGRVTGISDATYPGVNVGSNAGDPSSLSNGDLWYNSSTSRTRVYEGGTAKDLTSAKAATLVVDPGGEGDHTTIAAAVSALPAGGGHIYLREGTHTLTSTIAMPNKSVVIRGSGKGSLVVLPTGSVGFQIDYRQAYQFSDFTVEGNDTAGQYLFQTSSTSPTTDDERITVSRLIVGQGTAPNKQIERFIYQTTTYPYRWVVEDCLVALRVHSNARFWQAAGNYPGYLEMRNVNINSGYGGASATLSNLVVRAVDCVIRVSEGWHSYLDSTYAGCDFVGVVGRTNLVTQRQQAYRVKYTGCTFKDYAYLQIKYLNDGCAVQGCSFISNVATQIECTNAYNAQITGCFFENATSKPIRIYNSSYQVSVVGCTFDGASGAVNQIAIESSQQCAVVGNVFAAQATQGAILLSGTGYHAVVGNTQRYGSQRLVTESSSAYNNIANNVGTWASTITSDTTKIEGDNVRTLTAIFPSTAWTLDTENYKTVLANANAGTAYLDLPTAASARYRKFKVIRTDSSSYIVRIRPNGVETINGAAQFDVAAQFDAVEIISDGTEWKITGGKGGFVAAGTHAATVIVDAAGRGDATTIAAGIALLPAAGGLIFIREGTYAISATITLPEKDIRFVGAGRDAVVVDMGANVISAFSWGIMATIPYWHFSDLTIIGGNVAGQKAFEVLSSATQTYISLERVNIGRIAGAQIEKIFYGSGDRVIGTVDVDDVELVTRDHADAAIFEAAGSTIRGRRLYHKYGYGGWGVGVGTGVMGPGDGWHIEAQNNILPASGIYLVNSYIKLTGCYLNNPSTESYLTACKFELSGAAYVALNGNAVHVTEGYFDGAVTKPLRVGSDATVVGCRFENWVSYALEVQGVNACIANNVNCKVEEVGGANANVYVGNDGFAGSLLIGATSIAEGRGVRTIAGTTTIDESYRVVLANAAGGAMDVDLPTAASMKHRGFTIKKIDASANAVTIDPDGVETIDGVAGLALSAQYDSAIIISDGTSWKVLATKDAGGGAVTVDPRDIFRYSLVHAVS